MSDWLGIDEVLRTSWSDDHRETMTLAEVHALLGNHPRRLVGELVDAGLLEREDDGSFVAPSAGCSTSRCACSTRASASTSPGAPPSSCAGGSRRPPTTSSSCSRARPAARSRARADPTRSAAALDALRPIALDAAGLILAQELERALRALASRRHGRASAADAGRAQTFAAEVARIVALSALDRWRDATEPVCAAAGAERRLHGVHRGAERLRCPVPIVGKWCGRGRTSAADGFVVGTGGLRAFRRVRERRDPQRCAVAPLLPELEISVARTGDRVVAPNGTDPNARPLVARRRIVAVSRWSAVPCR